MATVLGLANGALLLCRNATLATTSDNVPGQYDIASVYAGSVQYCLEQGLFNFARRSATISGSTGASALGYTYGYTKPADFIRLASISNSTAFYPPMEHYEEDAVNWYGVDPTAYITYTSNSTSYGNNLAIWPETFTKTVEAYLAWRIYPHIATAPKEEVDRVWGVFERCLSASIAKDAQNQLSRVTDGTRESVYQGALRLVGFRPLYRATDEAVYKRLHGMMPASQEDAARVGEFAQSDLLKELTARQMLDEAYSNAIAWMIQQGFWNWGQKSVALTHDPSVEPSFGYSFAFDKPNDFVRLVQMSANDLFYPQCEDFIDEGGYWSASFDPLYVIYISNDPTHGANTNVWPRTVKRALEAYLAFEIAPYMNLPMQRIEMLKQHLLSTMRDARSKDALDHPPGKESPGRMTRSRTVWRGNAWRERR